MLIAGVDEVGRGCLAGPVVASAVILINPIINELKDSKKLSSKKREELFKIISENSIYSIALSSVEEIDKLNILQASLLAMKRAIEGLEICPNLVKIDGNKAPKLDNKNIQIETIIDGDNLIPEISAASIMAKVYRDNLCINELDKKYPEYNFFSNKCYGTKKHLEAINKFGITDIHRKSFKPIKYYINLI